MGTFQNGLENYRLDNFQNEIIMKTGIELIAEERQEQIVKHGYDQNHDRDHLSGELAGAAVFAMTLQEHFKQVGFEAFEEKMWKKSQIERYKIAGALIAAEIDRLNKSL